MKTTINGVPMPSEQECIDKLGFDLVDADEPNLKERIQNLKRLINFFNQYAKIVKEPITEEESDTLNGLFGLINSEIESLKSHVDKLKTK